MTIIFFHTLDQILLHVDNLKNSFDECFFSILADTTGRNVQMQPAQDDLIPNNGPEVAIGNPLQPHLVLHHGATVFSNIAEAISHEAEVREKNKELLDLQIEEKKVMIEKQRILNEKEALLVEKEKVEIERVRVSFKIEQLKFREMWEKYDKNKE